MTGTDAFQAGADEVRAISDTLAFLTADSRKGKSWRAMSDSNREKPNLLLAYLPDNPQNNACLAKILGDPTDYDDLEEYQDEAEPIYEALCKQVLGNLKDVRKKNRNAKVNLILLETLDPGRKQVVYENTFTAERLCENLTTWNIASQNTPPIEIRIRDKKENASINDLAASREVFAARPFDTSGRRGKPRGIEPFYVIKPICPFPGDICKLFKTNYTRSGSGKPMKQSDVSLHEIYSLYTPSLQTDRSQLVERFFRLTVQKSRRSLGDIVHRQIANNALPPIKQSQTWAKQAARFASLLSILLYLSEIGKENYMLDAPFNVGQFMKLADMLHKEYCVQVRSRDKKKPSIPPQLMGNEMLPIASENPLEGLNRLRDRMRIYLAWAESATGENIRRAKWILARFGEVSMKIATAGSELPEQFSPAQQAQVLLGYLAAIPHEKKEDSFDKPNIKEENSDD
jgi:hypothetical protein